MQVDPRLERLQALIEQKRMYVQQAGNTDSIRSNNQNGEVSRETERSKFVPPGNGSAMPIRRGSTLPSVTKSENPLSKSFQEFKIEGESKRTIAGPGKEHLGQNLDLYA
ncbi:hypothetical protein K8I28_07520 [bacterium]|nr:hypothetical protein [bacterium]